MRKDNIICGTGKIHKNKRNYNTKKNIIRLPPIEYNSFYFDFFSNK